MIPVLHNRWKIQGRNLVYYGIRRKPYTLKNRIKLSKKDRDIIQSLDGKHSLEHYKTTRTILKLISQGIIIDAASQTALPESFDDAVFCKKCIANNFMIPGIEFDENGLCPMCANEVHFRKYKSIIPSIKNIPRSRQSRFDVALFYTGGKDSSFLLYYLSTKLKLRVLALTWKTPYMSDSALQSIENAKRALPNVTFMSKKIEPALLAPVYNKLYELQGNTCACPSLAYLLYLPVLVDEKIPYLVLGNEPVQMKNLLFNGMAPPIAFIFAENKWLHLLANIGRLFTFGKPLYRGQFQMLATLSQLAYGDHPLKRLLGYQNTLLSNICTAIKESPELLERFKLYLKRSRRSGSFPALVHIDLNEIAEANVYDWSSVKDLLQKEIGWVDTGSGHKSLHTSCKIERCKDYSQLAGFRNMHSDVIPFSAIELSLAVGTGNVSREQAMAELRTHSGFSLTPPVETEIMLKELPYKNANPVSSYRGCSDKNMGEEK